MKVNINFVKALLTIGAVAGVAGTAYFSAKNGEKICDAWRLTLEETKDMDKPSKIKHVVKNAGYLAKPSWKVLVTGGATTACILASHTINAKQIAALTATCAFLTRNRNYLEDKLKETVGEEKLAKIKEEFVKKEYVEKVVYGGPSVETSVLCHEYGDKGVLCFDGWSGRWFRCPEEAVIDAQNNLIKMFDEDIYCCYNDFFGFLGITMTNFGHQWGFVNNPDFFSGLHFTNTLLTPEEWGDYGPDGRCVDEPVLVIEIDEWPMECWQEV